MAGPEGRPRRSEPGGPPGSRRVPGRLPVRHSTIARASRLLAAHAAAAGSVVAAAAAPAELPAASPPPPPPARQGLGGGRGGGDSADRLRPPCPPIRRASESDSDSVRHPPARFRMTVIRVRNLLVTRTGGAGWPWPGLPLPASRRDGHCRRARMRAATVTTVAGTGRPRL